MVVYGTVLLVQLAVLFFSVTTVLHLAERWFGVETTYVVSSYLPDYRPRYVVRLSVRSGS